NSRNGMRRAVGSLGRFFGIISGTVGSSPLGSVADTIVSWQDMPDGLDPAGPGVRRRRILPGTGDEGRTVGGGRGMPRAAAPLAGRAIVPATPWRWRRRGRGGYDGAGWGGDARGVRPSRMQT